jgi:hypothetical protein
MVLCLFKVADLLRLNHAGNRLAGGSSTFDVATGKEDALYNRT